MFSRLLTFVYPSLSRAIDFVTGKALEYEDLEDEDDDYEGCEEDNEDDDEEVSLCEGVGDLAPTPPVLYTRFPHRY